MINCTPTVQVLDFCHLMIVFPNTPVHKHKTLFPWTAKETETLKLLNPEPQTHHQTRNPETQA